MEAGGLRCPAMDGATHQVTGLVGAVAVGDGGSPLRGDAPDDFVVTSEAVLPWPSDDPTGEFVWRAVSLRDVFSRELLELCARDADEPPKCEDDGDGSAAGRSGSCPGESAGSATAGAAGGEDRAGARDPEAPPALTAIEGSSGRGRWPRGEGGGGVIDVDADPPPASAAGSSIRRLRIAARRTGEVASVLGKRKAAGPARIVGAAARPAIFRRVGAGSVGAGTPSDR